MNSKQLKQIIREEVQRVLKEGTESAAPFYYMQFNGTVQPMGPTKEDPTGADRSNRVSRGPLNKPTDVLSVRRFPKNSWKEMDIYKMMINKKPGYVLISADRRNRWAIIPVDAKFNASVTSGNENYRYSYMIAFDAVTSAKEKGEKITPEEFLGKVSESTSLVKEASSKPLKDLDFAKFDKILKLVSTPLTAAILDDESEDYEGDTISGFKSFSKIKYISKFLNDFSKLYSTNFNKTLDLLDKNTDTMFTISDDDDGAEVLRDKNLAKQLIELNDKLSDLMYAVYDIEPDDVAKIYNEIADIVKKFKV